MRKCLLVILIGIVLAMNLYGLVNEFISKTVEIDRSYTVVYVE